MLCMVLGSPVELSGFDCGSAEPPIFSARRLQEAEAAGPGFGTQLAPPRTLQGDVKNTVCLLVRVPVGVFLFFLGGRELGFKATGKPLFVGVKQTHPEAAPWS